MKKEIADKWCEALEGGEYKQGKKYLHNDKGEMCCLGVLADLYKKETGIGEWEQSQVQNENYFIFKTRLEHSAVSLDSEITEWAGMKHLNTLGQYGVMEIDYSTGITHKAALHADNDQYGKSFKEIAEIIRENYEKL